MQYSSNDQRVPAAILDGFILFFVLHIIAFAYAFKTGAIPDDGATWVVVLEMILMPFVAIIQFYSDSDIGGFHYYMIYVLLFCSETLYYSFIYIGHRVARTDICNLDGTKPSVSKIILRSSLKTLARYLFMLPCLTIFRTSTNQTLYDIMAETLVIDRPPKNK